MFRQWLKQHLPKGETFKKYRAFSWLGTWLAHPNLWHINRHSTTKAVAIGLFILCMPIPIQALLAAVCAILLRANLPIAVVLSWINNPLTFVPINYFIYRVGDWVLNEPISKMAFNEFNWEVHNLQVLWSSFVAWVSQFGKAFFVGLPIVAISLTLLGYIAVSLLWRVGVVLQQRKRKQRHSAAVLQNS